MTFNNDFFFFVCFSFEKEQKETLSQEILMASLKGNIRFQVWPKIDKFEETAN